VISFKALVAATLLASTHAASAAAPDPAVRPTGVIFDPLFGIPIPWGGVPFTKAPQLVYSCAQWKNQPRGYLFLFGHTTQDGMTYELIHGWELVTGDDAAGSSPHFEQDVTATVVIIKNHECVGSMSDGYVWSTHERDRAIAASKYGITDRVATALLDDGFQRTVGAFGGATSFLKKLDDKSSSTAAVQLDYLANKVSSLRASDARSVK
jgi:hypothetical protein